MHQEKTRQFRKFRRLTYGNKTGDAYGITIPRSIVEQFSDVSFSIHASGTCIILQSGCDVNVRT